MIITTHVLAGAAIASQTDNVWAIIILAFLSHILLDALPHTDEGTLMPPGEQNFGRLEVILGFIDTIVAAISILLILYFKYDRFWLILLGAFFAGLIDYIDNVPFWRQYLWQIKFGKRQPFLAFHHFHEWIHFKIPKRLWYWGLMVDILVTFVAIWYIIK